MMPARVFAIVLIVGCAALGAAASQAQAPSDAAEGACKLVDRYTRLGHDPAVRIVIEGTPTTPSMMLNLSEGVLAIQGRSIPENSIEFYAPLEDWLDKFSKTGPRAMVVHVFLQDFNTSSSKSMLDVFRKLERIHVRDLSSVTINWYYEEDDEDMLEAGEDYRVLVPAVPFYLLTADAFPSMPGVGRR